MRSWVFGGGLRAGVAAGVAACLVGVSGGGASAVSEAVSVDPVEGYVERVYLDLLGRGPDPTGRAAWSAAVRSGAPRVQVANGITGSDEYRARLIRAAYQRYLNSPPDPAGLAAWLTAMRRGATIQLLEAGILASPQYMAEAGSGWVQAMYQDVLERDAQPAEVALWQGALARGASPQRIALSILLSDEHLSDVLTADYQTLLGRGLDDQGRRGWVSAIQAGTRYEQAVGGILASNEYWVLGIPDDSIPLRGEGRIGTFPANAPAAAVRTFLTTELGAAPVEVEDDGTCPGAQLWEWDGLLLVERSTDEAGAPVAPYAAAWIVFGPPSDITDQLHTAEGLRVGDPEGRIVEVYPNADEYHPDPATHLWVDDPDDPSYDFSAFDEGQGRVVDAMLSGNGCDE